jgi:hypothetical protein
MLQIFKRWQGHACFGPVCFLRQFGLFVVVVCAPSVGAQSLRPQYRASQYRAINIKQTLLKSRRITKKTYNANNKGFWPKSPDVIKLYSG